VRLTDQDLVLIGTSLFLGATALLAPWVAEWLKRWGYAPSLDIEFSQEGPYCHLTRRQNGSAVYYFRFKVVNRGRSQARLCESILEAIATADISGRYVPEPNFSPIPLTWAGVGATYIALNPERIFFCDIGHISEPGFQKTHEPSKYVGITLQQQALLKLKFDTPYVFFSQWDTLVPGKHRVTVGVYCENARPVRRTFIIAWSGQWQAAERDMYREIVIT
jgi:hypothetical protein